MRLWKPETGTLPPGLTLADVEADTRLLKGALDPIDKPRLQVVLNALREWIDTFQDVDPVRLENALVDYAHVLKDMPADLAALAVRRIKTGYRYPTMPKPGDLSEMVKEEFNARHWAWTVLDRARLCGRDRAPERPAPTPEQRERVEAIMAKTRAVLQAPDPDIDLTDDGPDEPPKVQQRRADRKDRWDRQGSAALRRMREQQGYGADEEQTEQKEAV